MAAPFPSAITTTTQPLEGIPPSNASPFAAAMEVLHLLGFVLDMWSRHRESLRAMACRGNNMREEDKEVVERLGKELKELLEEEEMMQDDSSLSSSKGGTEEEEEGQQEEARGEADAASSSGEQQAQASAASARKRSRRRRRKRIRKASQAVSDKSETQAGDHGSRQPVNMTPALPPLPPPSVTIEYLPEVVLMRVVDMLGTPPRVNHPEEGSHRLIPATFLSDLTSMAQVCHRWKKVVRSSGVWKAVCEWRWPWLLRQEGRDLMAPLAKARHRAIREDRRGDREPPSPWLDLCLRVGRHRREGTMYHNSKMRRWVDDYIMLVEISTHWWARLLSSVGGLRIFWHGDVDDGIDGGPRVLWYVNNITPPLLEETWPIHQALGLQPGANAREALCSTPLSVDVMLLDRKTSKLAVLYSGDDLFYYPLDNGRLQNTQPCRLKVPGKDLSVRLDCNLDLFRRQEGGDTFASFVLEMRTRQDITHGDIYRLIRSLQWL